jgi:hypothetical protein
MRNVRRRASRGYNHKRAAQKRLRNSDIGKWIIDNPRRQLGKRVIREIITGDGSITRIYGVKVHGSCFIGFDNIVYNREVIDICAPDILEF